MTSFIILTGLTCFVQLILKWRLWIYQNKNKALVDRFKALHGENHKIYFDGYLFMKSILNWVLFFNILCLIIYIFINLYE